MPSRLPTPPSAATEHLVALIDAAAGKQLPAALPAAAAADLRATDTAAAETLLVAVFRATRIVAALFACAVIAAAIALDGRALGMLAAAYAVTGLYFGATTRAGFVLRRTTGALARMLAAAVVWAPVVAMNAIAARQMDLLIAGRVAARRRALAGLADCARRTDLR